MADQNFNVTDSVRIGLADAIPNLIKTFSPTQAEYLIANETIFPSGYDIAAIAGDGITMRERSLSDNWLGLLSDNFVVSGLLIPASSVNLNIIIPLGVAEIAGRWLSVPATTITCPASSTSYIFLKVTRDANLNVTGGWYEVNTTGTAPADCILIATAVTSGSAITSTVDRRLVGRHGMIILTSGTSWIVPGGLRNILVQVIGASGGGGGGVGNAGPAPTDGGPGGTTTFDTLSVTGGTGGSIGGSSTAGAAHGVGSGGQLNRTGGGQSGGNGGNSNIFTSDGNGHDGGDGGVASSYLPVTPGATISIAIGAAGTAGAAGGGAGGGAGRAGQAGMIIVRY